MTTACKPLAGGGAVPQAPRNNLWKGTGIHARPLYSSWGSIGTT